MQRVLVVKLADFGDALLTTPALRALRDAVPEATIDMLTTPIAAQVYRCTDLVDGIDTFAKGEFDRVAGVLGRPMAPVALGRRLRGRRYDTVVLLHHLTTRFGAAKHAALTLSTGAPRRAGLVRPGSPRGWFLTHRAVDMGFDGGHEVEAALAVVAAAGVDVGRSAPRLEFRRSPAAEAAAEALLRPLAGAPGPRVALHPGTGPYSPARRWSAQGFAAVADALAGDGASIVLVGTDGDGTAAVRRASSAGDRMLDLTGETDLPTLASVLARTDLLVGNDSGVTHLATAVGVPVVAVFGPSNPTAWGPWWPGADADGRPAPSPHQVVQLGLPCQPCLYSGFGLGDRHGCGTRECLAWLPTAQVIAACRRRLVTPGAAPHGRDSGAVAAQNDPSSSDQM